MPHAREKSKKGAKKLDSHQIIQSIQGQSTDETLQNALRVALQVTCTSMSLYVRGDITSHLLKRRRRSKVTVY